MNKISNLDSSDAQDTQIQLIQTDSVLELLPEEVILGIFKHLNEETEETIESTSSYLSKFLISEKTRDKRIEITEFIETVLTVLGDNATEDQITALNSIMLSLEDVEFLSFFTLNTHILSVKEEFLNVLITLDDEVFSSLKEFIVPDFFGDLFALAEICREIPNAAALPTKRLRSAAYREICLKLARAGYIARAIKQANAIENPYLALSLLEEIAVELANDGNIAGASEVLSTLPEEWLLRPIEAISTALARTRNVTGAIELANTLPQGWFIQTLQNVSYALALEGHIGESIEVLAPLPEESLIEALEENAVSLAQFGDNDSAFLIIGTIPDGSVQERLYDAIDNM